MTARPFSKRSVQGLHFFSSSAIPVPICAGTDAILGQASQFEASSTTRAADDRISTQILTTSIGATLINAIGDEETTCIRHPDNAMGFTGGDNTLSASANITSSPGTTATDAPSSLGIGTAAVTQANFLKQDISVRVTDKASTVSTWSMLNSSLTVSAVPVPPKATVASTTTATAVESSVTINNINSEECNS